MSSKLSDLIRCESPVWLWRRLVRLSTLYVTGWSSASYLANDFIPFLHVVKNGIPSMWPITRWAMFCIAGSANLWFSDFTGFSGGILYGMNYRLIIFLSTTSWTLAIGASDVIREAIDAVPSRIIRTCIFIANHANDFVDVSEWDRVKSTTQLYKCSYKISLTATGDTTIIVCSIKHS